jgi:hypothetical protein
MKKLLVLLLWAFPAYADGPGTDWVNLINIAFMPGFSDMANAPDNVRNPAKAEELALLIRDDCQNVNFEEMYVRNTARQFIDYTETGRRPDPCGEWIFFRVTVPQVVPFVGYRVANYSHMTCHTEVWQRRVPTPPPPPPPPEPGVPTLHDCQNVSFLLKAEYGSSIEQATVLEATPEQACSVYLRFVNSGGHQFYLDRRQAQQKSPDFEVLQPENVKVVLHHTSL